MFSFVLIYCGPLFVLRRSLARPLDNRPGQFRRTGFSNYISGYYLICGCQIESSCFREQEPTFRGLILLSKQVNKKILVLNICTFRLTKFIQVILICKSGKNPANSRPSAILNWKTPRAFNCRNFMSQLFAKILLELGFMLTTLNPQFPKDRKYMIMPQV